MFSNFVHWTLNTVKICLRIRVSSFATVPSVHHVLSLVSPALCSEIMCELAVKHTVQTQMFPVFLRCRQNLLADCLQGCFVVTCTLCAFISLVWLREQIVHGGAPQWLEQNQPPLVPNQANGPAAANEVR